MLSIERIHLPTPGMELLLAEALVEGYDFIQALVDEWASGEIRFDGYGEALMGCRDRGTLIAVGGLTLDPYAGRADLGRIRKVYVRPAWRRGGMGGALTNALVAEARKSFGGVRLSAENADAARLYERIGFHPVPGPHATHGMVFDKREQSGESA